MVRERKGKRILAAALVVALAGGMVQNTGASPIRDAQDKINEANEQLDQTNSQISDIEKKQDTLQKEIDSLDSELVALLLDIEVLKDEIAQKEADIKQATSDLKQAQATADKQYESMKKRIRFMYERGDNALIESLLGAGSMADFLNRVEYFNQIYDYDRTMLTEYQETVTQVADLKQTLEQEQQDMVALQENQEHQSKELQEMLTKKRATMDDFDTKLAQAEALATQYKATIQEQNEIIVAEQARIAAEEEERRRQAEEQRRQEEERRRQEAAQQQQQQQQSNGSGGSSGGSSSGGSSGGSSDDGGANPDYRTNVSGQEVVNFAMQFVGNPYVWGGTSLTNGCDCSGFVMSVFGHFGISLPHSSYSLRSCGQGVSYSNAQPGDLICYSGHVAIYIGGGRIVGAQSSAIGIATQNATYRTILAVRRVL
ncbi:MAG: NlpC/P60 family protein [Lachnospiraceae bacterium]|nr:NlpC/P60 family protein [Lachnospiraceae bacterium]